MRPANAAFEAFEHVTKGLLLFHEHGYCDNHEGFSLDPSEVTRLDSY
jgi:hypothetical protein